MKLTRTPHISHTSLLTGLAVAAATLIVACHTEEKKPTSAWNCQSLDVPMGETVRCTQSALTQDGPTATPIYTDITSPDAIVYVCNAGDTDCPPADVTTAPGDAEQCSGSTDNPDLCPPPVTDDGSGTADETSGKGNNGNGAGGAGSNGDTKGNSSGGGSSTPGPDECSYVPDLPYCGGASGGGTSDGGSGGTSDGPPGKTKNDGSSDGTSAGGGSSKGNGNGSGNASSSGGASSGGSKGDGKGPSYTCKKDDKGNKSCESTPVCAPGTHPSACGACVADGESGDCVPPSAGGCWVTGGGFIVAPNLTTGAPEDGHDNFGGNAKPMKDGRIQGHWNHVDHGTGNHAKGKPEYIVCRHVDEPGPGQPGGKKGFTMNQVYFGGPAEWRADDTWSSGYWFDVVAKDHGEPGSQPHAKNGGMVDTYHFTIRKIDDPTQQVSGPIVYETKGDLVGGNIQMHPPNAGHPYSPMSLPSWVSYEP